MSGGHLVVLDRAGREVKKYDLPSGSAILGSDHSSDIRIMLPSVRPHHATVFVHDNQSVIRNVGSGETFLNGVSVSVAVLRQDDVVSLGGREFRWRYANPAPHHIRRRPDSPALQSARESRGARASRTSRGRRSDGAALCPPHASHRDSAPGAINTRQVAIVQPQRRDTADNIESVSSSAISVVINVHRRIAKSDSETDTSLNKSIEMNKSKSPKPSPINLQNTTKATLWIESRKSSPRKSLQEIPARVVITPKKTFSAKKSTPLRMAVLKKAQSAQKMRVTKIQAPSTIDHTKQAAIMLMTGHTPKQRGTPGRKVSLVVKRPRGRPSKSSLSASTSSTRGSSGSNRSLRSGSKASLERSPSVLEISDSESGQSVIRESDVSQQSERSSRGFMRSPTASPIKSALKDPKRSIRKTESIKFDLSNLDESPSPEDRNVRLRYSESPSPKPAHSRARDILRRTLGSDENITSSTSSPTPALFASPSSPRLARGSLMLHRALRSTSPTQMENYSVVDLVSVDSDSSLYSSASNASRYHSPNNSGRATRARSLAASTPAVPKMSRSRSAITSLSYDSIRDDSQMTHYSEVSRRSKSLSTPVDTQNGTYNVSKKKSQTPNNTEHLGNVTFNISRRSRQSLVTSDVSKENITDHRALSTAENTTETLDASTKSKRTRSTLTGENDIEDITLNSPRCRSQNRTQMSKASMTMASNKSNSESPKHDGTSTPKNQQSPEEAGTPVLSIQSLLDSDQNATLPQRFKKNCTTKALKRKTIGGRLSVSKKRESVKSKSLRLSTRAPLRTSKASNISPISSDSTEDVSQDDGETTPKSAVKLVQEAVKNKHSTAKKPKSKRSIIDNLNDSDIVKQLFNSPVKRKLSQSMIEFSRRQHLDEDIVPIKRATRKTIALGDRTPDNSVLEQSQAITPEIFVSPLSTPSNSPNLVGMKRLFAKSTPENDLRNVRGVKKLLQTPRLRRSVRNDLTQVSGVKSVFARSPKNRLSDVSIKEVFRASPKNDLRIVSGVKSLFRTEKKNKSPKNDLSDVAYVRKLYKRNSPRNDLGNVSGVKRVMRRNSPRNDLGDVRGVRTLFHLEKHRDDLNNISGIEELFSESHQTSNVTDANSENSFNLLIGKPAVRSYGSKAKSFSLKTIQKPKKRRAKSLQTSFSSISNNVEDWLENELRKRMHKDDENAPSTKESLDKPIEENMFNSTSKSKKSSNIMSRSMSRSKHILELSMSAQKGSNSANNTTNVTIEGNKTQINVSKSSVNKSKTNSEKSRKNMSRLRNQTANNKSVFTGGSDEISTGNITQFDASNTSNKSKTSRATPKKNISRSQNTTVNTVDIIVGADQVSKENESQVDVSNNSVNRSKTLKPLTPRKSSNRSKNKTAINSMEDGQASKGNETQFETSNKSVNKSKVQNEITPRKGMDKSKNRSASTKSDIVETNKISKDNTKINASNTAAHQLQTQSVETPRKSKSKNKTNRSRELLKLATDTVEGNTPLLTTRARNSTLTKTTLDEGERKKSTSEIYSAHTLPIKKRSLVDRDTSGNRSEKSVLPIKKRAVVHSTPVKGRLNLTMNASDIGRVSPIALIVEETIDADANPTTGNTEVTKISPRRKLLQGRSFKIVPVVEASKERISPAPVKSTRRKTKQSLDVNNVKKRKYSVVITKKTPSLSPKPSTNVSTNVPLVTEDTEPMRKPRGRKITRDQNLLQVDTETEILITKRGRKATLEVQTQKIVNESLKAKRGRKTDIEKDKQASISQQPSEESVPKPRKTRGQRVATEKVPTPKALTRTKASKVGVGRKEQIVPENNAKISEFEEESNVKPRRGRKAETNKVDPKGPETEKRPYRSAVQKNTNENTGRKSKKIVSKDTGNKSNSKTVDSGSSENFSRGRKRKITVEESSPNVKKSKTDDINSKKNQKVEKKTTESIQSISGRRQKKNLESSEHVEIVEESRTRRGRVTETEITEVRNKRASGRKAESRTMQTEAAEASNKSARGKRKESNTIIKETVEVRNVRGRKKQPDGTEIKSKQNVTETKRTRRGEGDVVKVNEETKSDSEVKTTRRQKAKQLEKTEAKGKSRQKVSEPEKAEAKAKSQNAEAKSKQKVSEPEKAKVKTTRRQKEIEPETTEVRTTRRQKATEPEKPIAGRKRKNDADGSTAKEAPRPSKTRKTQPVSPKATRARNTKVEEPQKPAARSRRR